jgi:hypothetical protein
MRLLLALAFVTLICTEVHALTWQWSSGDCSPIVNINLADKGQVEELFGPPPRSFETIARASAALFQCRKNSIDEVARLDSLSFALQQVIELKEQFIRPAFQALQADPNNAGQRAVLARYFYMLSTSSESAITYFIQVESEKNRLLDRMEASRLKKTLDSKLIYSMVSNQSQSQSAQSDFENNLAELKAEQADIKQRLSLLGRR